MELASISPVYPLDEVHRDERRTLFEADMGELLYTRSKGLKAGLPIGNHYHKGPPERKLKEWWIVEETRAFDLLVLDRTTGEKARAVVGECVIAIPEDVVHTGIPTRDGVDLRIVKTAPFVDENVLKQRPADLVQNTFRYVLDPKTF